MTARWSFNNDYLFDLVLTNRKHGTCCLYTSDKELSKIGDINIIYNSQNQEIKIKITGVCVRRFCDIDEQWAKIEGEGDLSLDYWKKIHLDFFLRENPYFKVTDLLELNNFVIIH